jgi:hypothetical protein
VIDEPSGAPGGEAEPAPPSPPSTGDRLQNLLFVTSHRKLAVNIGSREAEQVIASIRSSSTLVELPEHVTTAEQAAPVVRRMLASRRFRGVVLLGGYDVVPPQRLDVLDAASRRALVAAGQDGKDSDDFVVWSDDLYGDDDGDFLPELPVSRIPDGRSPLVVRGALAAAPFQASARFGVRNVHRPFAIDVFERIPGRGGKLEPSELFAPQMVAPNVAQGAVYFMLHGSARDATRFWGETRSAAAFEGFAVENVPATARGSIVFTGCCWGALAMSPPAARARPDAPLQPRAPEASIPVAYLKAGALAFVGCTGSHYSPMLKPYNYFGGPMHDAFWKHIKSGRFPAEALFLAKKEFAAGMPHGRTDPFSRAVELKISRQFTCLGLGW